MPEPDAPRDGAQPSGDEPQPDGRQRLRNALLKPSRSQIVVGVLLAIVGFAGIVQMKDEAADDAYSGLRENQLIEVLDGLTGTAERARDEIARLERTQARLKNRSSARTTALEEAQQRLRALNILSGQVAVQGPGVRITITPGVGPVSLSSLLDTVQELRTAGAESIEFNDEIRVVAQSSFNSSTIGLELDGVLLNAPYVIEAIGDPHVMETALRLTDGPVDGLEDDGATVTIEQVNQLQIESIREAARMPHASIDDGE